MRRATGPAGKARACRDSLEKKGSSPISGFARSQTEGSGTSPCRQDTRRGSGPSLRPGTCLTSILSRGSKSGTASNREQDVLSSAAWRRDSRRCQTPRLPRGQRPRKICCSHVDARKSAMNQKKPLSSAPRLDRSAKISFETLAAAAKDR